MFTLAFWKATLERTIGTFAAAFVGLAIVNNPFEYMSLPWGDITVTSLIITGMTVLKTLGAGASNGSPGFGTAEQLSQ